MSCCVDLFAEIQPSNLMWPWILWMASWTMASRCKCDTLGGWMIQGSKNGIARTANTALHDFYANSTSLDRFACKLQCSPFLRGAVRRRQTHRKKIRWNYIFQYRRSAYATRSRLCFKRIENEDFQGVLCFFPQIYSAAETCAHDWLIKHCCYQCVVRVRSGPRRISCGCSCRQVHEYP